MSHINPQCRVRIRFSYSVGWKVGTIYVFFGVLRGVLAPAVGSIVGGGGESLVVAFADGFVAALDADLEPLPGWPMDLGASLSVAPVLCDLDRDGLHEIVLPVRDQVTGQLTMRILTGQGTPGTGDGTLIPSPEGGGWLSLSPALVAGGRSRANRFHS